MEKHINVCYKINTETTDCFSVGKLYTNQRIYYFILCHRSV